MSLEVKVIYLRQMSILEVHPQLGCLMGYTTCLVCLVSTVSGRCKNTLRRASTRSRHITILEQSSFIRYLWLNFTCFDGLITDVYNKLQLSVVQSTFCRNFTTMSVPIIDGIDYNTFKYQPVYHGDTHFRGEPSMLTIYGSNLLRLFIDFTTVNNISAVKSLFS